MKIGAAFPARTIPRMDASDLARFEAKVEPEPNSGCWLWTGAVLRNGYPVFGIGGRVGRSFLAHRVSLSQFRGGLSGDLEVDHLCRVRSCVNPDHLQAVTTRENMRRSVKPYCRKGHAHSEPYMWKGHRYCRECRRLVTQRRRGCR